MFEKFGELNSFGEINELAENLFNEGDTESLRAMAKENGIQSDFVDMYLQGEIPALCDQLTAALGKIDVEVAELKPKEIMEDWVEYLRGQCMENELLAFNVRKKGKSLKGCIAALLMWSFKNQQTVDKDIIKAAGVSAGKVTLGIPGITMFLSTSVLNNLMKKAYKTGLVVARTQDAQGNDWLYLAGSYWEVSVNKDFIPKKTLGDIITLIGELPRPGERFKATKEGNQIEIEMPMAINEEGFGTETLTITDVLLIGTQGTVQRLLQDDLTGQIYPINNVFVSIINNAMVEEDKGEYTVTEPLFNPFRGILWKNNVCKLRAHFRTDDKNIKVLKSLKGVDITPEVPEE